MGKSSKSTKPLSSAPPSVGGGCRCTDLYRCSCGLRPPRPSKGHCWNADVQQWGGKGHKQRGASQQAAVTARPATQTSVANVEEWQRLPSFLLQHECQRLKRPLPKYQQIPNPRSLDDNDATTTETFLYKVILPDASSKQNDKDYVFVPVTKAPSLEQAKEEAALLALHTLTPHLPHELKLPEPFRTQWKQMQQQGGKSNNNKSKKSSTKTDSTEASSTTTTTDAPVLQSAYAFPSRAQQKQHTQQQQAERKAKIRRHEAIRLANAPHPVFMSTTHRRLVEQLLRNESIEQALMNTPQEEDSDNDPAAQLSDVQLYVQQRLVQQGLEDTHPIVTNAIQALGTDDDTDTMPESQWDQIYERTLQQILIHMPEDQLPDALDPRGRTLDVIVPTTTSNTPVPTTTRAEMAKFLRYGLSVADATRLCQRRSSSSNERRQLHDVVWEALLKVAGLEYVDDTVDATTTTTTLLSLQENGCRLQEEVEALEAIFGSDFTHSIGDDSVTEMSIPVSPKVSLWVRVRNGEYPSKRPLQVLLVGEWPSEDGRGISIQIELIQQWAMQELGEPMVFALHTGVASLLEQLDEFPPRQLFETTTRVPVTPSSTDKVEAESEMSLAGTSQNKRMTVRKPRPRDKSPFWSLSPTVVPAAVAFPTIDKTLDIQRRSLPAAAARSEFLELLRSAEQRGRVLLVTGDTGCGKTTQIPQFILEEAPHSAKIVVAQPRRLAATGVASRVANERGESQPGSGSVGCVVRGDSALGKNTRLLFCTTGVLLRQLQMEGALDRITHIVVDEVHERHMDTDVLLGILKQCLPKYKNLCVVLMSATLDTDKFARYWGDNTPRINIPGRTFPVTDYFLEDVLRLTGYVPRTKKMKHTSRGGLATPESDDEGSGGDQVQGIPMEELLKRVDECVVDYLLLGKLVQRVVSSEERGDGSILVFLSGVAEINQAVEAIKRSCSVLPIHILPLHGGLQPKEQNLVFRPPPVGLVKIVVSTNVCETSITIPDVTVVIDTGLEKQNSYDPSNRMPLLVEQFVSRASLKQRKGRAGRVREGYCYKLLSRSTVKRLREHTEPEIRRCALEQTLLSLVYMGLERRSGEFVRKLLDPPEEDSVHAAIHGLRKLGALEQSGGEQLNLTPLGRHLASIPSPPVVGKLLVMGSILGCRDSALAMAAGMTVGRSPFLRVDNARRSSKGEEDESKEALKAQQILKNRKDLAKLVGNSDHAMLAEMHRRWGDTKAGSGTRKELCDQLGLSFTGMRELDHLVKQLDASLALAGFVDSTPSNLNARSFRVIRACVVSALSPTQIVKVVRPAAKYHDTAQGAMEKDGKAQELKFFILSNQDAKSDAAGAKEERVFIHPSSANFSTSSYSCPWLVYHSLVRTSKPFLRDVTECSSFPLLLFGGDIAVRASEGTITIDGWISLSANARIASLIGGLRQRVDEILVRKVNEPTLDIAATEEMRLVVKLLQTDRYGLD